VTLRGVVAATVAVVALASLPHAELAYADGDPASDYLVANRVFLSSLSASTSTSQRQLTSLVAAANRSGYAIRVATIATEYDLGSITALWRRPQVYARFLGLELSAAYKGPLLVVMPNGFGFNWPGHSAASAYRLLSAVPVRPADSSLADAAQVAVRRLAAAAGIKLGPVPRPPTTGAVAHKRAGSEPILIIAVIVAALAGAALVLFALRRQRRPATTAAAGAAEQATAPPNAVRGALPVRRRWAVPGFAALIVIATGTPIVLLAGFRHTAASSTPAAAVVVTPPPFSWPAGRRAAPAFTLRDQDGHRVTASEFRGRTLIVTFVDPLCRNLCPLEAHLLNQVVSGMPAGRRPEIVAVSVDVYADKRADLLQDDRQWQLVPQWHWAVGTPAQLAAAWKQYQIGVSVTTKRIAGTTINYITHTEAAYVIDATGHERALFLWPFYPQDLKRVLQQVA
jgi:cytochrome oxidase Cu insertion factor (SCO1/SenC/PrrC family)